MNISQIIRDLSRSISGTDIAICLAGLILLGWWAVKTSLGRRALVDSPPRRNSMLAFTPFIPLFIWFGGIAVAMPIKEAVMGDLAGWQSAFFDNLALLISGVATIAVIIYLARAHFARRLKGFGLNVKTIPKDFLLAFVNLLAAWPVLTLAIIMTVFFGTLIYGPEFRIDQHEQLEMISEYSQLWLRVLVVLVAVVMAPVLEEMLFRGLFQTVVRSYLAESVLFSRSRSDSLAPWVSIVLSSVLFTLVHPTGGHWPALFVLAVCLGYSYEKSGSLFRPIFIHAIFNAISILAVLSQ